MPVGLTHYPAEDEVAKAYVEEPEELLGLLDALGEHLTDRTVDEMKGYHADPKNLERLAKVLDTLIVDLRN